MTDRLASVALRRAAASDLLPDRLRAPLLRFTGVGIGDRVLITSGTRFAKFAEVSIGAGSYLNHDCYLDAQADITLGENISVGDHVRFVTSTHETGGPESRAGRNTGRRIVVHDGCWIGSSVVILPGVTIGAGSVIAAGAVVTSDCAPHHLHAGVPARAVRALESA